MGLVERFQTDETVPFFVLPRCHRGSRAKRP
jgi:hypothetical protein